MAIQVIGLGAGGHAKVVLEILRAQPRFKVIGLLAARQESKGQKVLGVPVLGDDTELHRLRRRGCRHFFVGIGSIGDTTPRRRLYEMALEHQMKPVSAIHPQAVVSRSAALGPGVTIMAGAVVNACASLGANVVVNTGAIVEHDCVLGDHAHVATGARLAGGVRVGAMAHIGAGATVRQYLSIGEAAIVGAGAVVVKDVPPNTVVAGVPARELRKKRKGARG